MHGALPEVRNAPKWQTKGCKGCCHADMSVPLPKVLCHHHQAVLQEVTVQFNLCMEPWLKYAMHLVADQGLRRQLWTSSRLLQEVLFLETHRCCLSLQA